MLPRPMSLARIAMTPARVVFPVDREPRLANLVTVR